MSTMSDAKDETPPMLPLSVPCLQGREWEYVKECLDTGWVSSVGAFVDRFEREIATVAGTNHAVATVNATAALHTGLLVAGVQRDDEVVVSTLTFVASANAIRHAQAWPVFIDSEPKHWQIDPDLGDEFLTGHCRWQNGALWNRQTGRRVSAIMPVHVLGHPCDMDALLDLAQRFDLKVIEDSAEGLGAKYKGSPVGCLGDIGCFSFNGNKLITTGGGGMLVTNDSDLARRARHLTTQAKSDPSEYIHDQVGYNYRMTNVLAALGCAQLEQLPMFVDARRKLADKYSSQLASVPGIVPLSVSENAFCTHWLYTVRVIANECGMDRQTLQTELSAGGIQTRPLWQPMHRSPAHGDAYTMLSGVADRLYDECLSLPSSFQTTSEEQIRVVQQISDRIQGSNGTQAA